MGEIEDNQLGVLIKSYLRDGLVFRPDSVSLPYGSYDFGQIIVRGDAYGTYYDYDFGDLDKLFGEISVKNQNILTNGLPDNWDNEDIK